MQPKLSAGRGGRHVLWGAHGRDVQVGGAVDRNHQANGRPLTPTKRGRRIGW